MSNFIASLKDKRFRLGTFSTAMMLIAITLFFMVNLVAQEFNRHWDITRERMFTLSHHSLSFLEDLDQEISIFYIVRTGDDDLMLSQLLLEYENASPWISVENRDPILNPTFVLGFSTPDGSGIGNHSVIVQSARRYRVIDPMDMLGTQMEMTHWGPMEVPVSFNFEHEITRAIHYVTMDEPTVVYVVYGSGEGEQDVPEALVNRLISENFAVRRINLVWNEVPYDADILFITQPDRDWTEHKGTRIADFLSVGGRAFMAFQHDSFERFPIMDSVLANYGIEVGQYTVLEFDTRQTHMNVPFFKRPITHTHEVTATLQTGRQDTLMLMATGIDLLPSRRHEVDIQTLLRTTSNSIGIGEEIEDEPMQEILGPFNLGVAITDTFFTYRLINTRIVMIGSLSFLESGVNSSSSDGNYVFIIDSLNWLHERPSTLWIPTMAIPGRVDLNITSRQANTLAVVAIGGFPAACALVGVFIWYKRRYS